MDLNLPANPKTDRRGLVVRERDGAVKQSTFSAVTMEGMEGMEDPFFYDPTTTCLGCIEGQPNQLAHEGPGGCLRIETSPSPYSPEKEEEKEKEKENVHVTMKVNDDNEKWRKAWLRKTDGRLYSFWVRVNVDVDVDAEMEA